MSDYITISEAKKLFCPMCADTKALISLVGLIPSMALGEKGVNQVAEHLNADKTIRDADKCCADRCAVWIACSAGSGRCGLINHKVEL